MSKGISITYSLLAGVALLGLVVVRYLQPTSVSIPITATSTIVTATTTPRSYYEPLIPFTLGEESMYASLATTEAARQLGLSNTTELPSDVVKVFVFPQDGIWSFWMKDMQYPIDMLWVSASGTIVHIVENATPASYPNTTYKPLLKARYVYETVAGFATAHDLVVGSTVTVPTIP